MHARTLRGQTFVTQSVDSLRSHAERGNESNIEGETTMKHLLFILSTFLILHSQFSIASPAPVAKTGQTVSYMAGDDGALRPGVAAPSPRFSDNANGTVTDNQMFLTSIMLVIVIFSK